MNSASQENLPDSAEERGRKQNAFSAVLRGTAARPAVFYPKALRRPSMTIQ
jgi:hypothetical protein